MVLLLEADFLLEKIIKVHENAFLRLLVLTGRHVLFEFFLSLLRRVLAAMSRFGFLELLIGRVGLLNCRAIILEEFLPAIGDELMISHALIDRLDSLGLEIELGIEQELF